MKKLTRMVGTGLMMGAVAFGASGCSNEEEQRQNDLAGIVARVSESVTRRCAITGCEHPIQCSASAIEYFNQALEQMIESAGGADGLSGLQHRNLLDAARNAAVRQLNTNRPIPVAETEYEAGN